MKTTKLTLLALALMMAGVVKTHAQNADDIAKKHMDAIGGEANWKKVSSIKMSGTMNLQGTDIAIATTVLQGKAMRLDINAMGMSGYQILTSKEGWSYMPMQGQTKPVAMTDEEVKQGQDQLIVQDELMDYKQKGNKVAYTGKEKVDNADCYKLQVTSKEGEEETLFLDATTYYKVKTVAKVKADGKEQDVVSTFGDYKKQDGGIVLPMKINAGGQEITFKTIEVNKPVDESIFKPGA